MIQRIRPSEYLTDIRTMTDGERKDYLKRVGEWLAGSGRRLMQMTDRPMALSQNVVQLSVRWTADECRMFRDGTLLLTALVKTCDTWLPAQLYARSANRAVRKICHELAEVSGFKFQVSGKADAKIQTPPLTPPLDGRGAATALQPRGAKQNPAAMQNPTAKQSQGAKQSPEAKRANHAAANQPQGTPLPSRGGAGAGSQPETLRSTSGRLLPTGRKNLKPGTSGTAVPRPDHISQYIHLLPEATQERAKDYGSLMRQMEEAHANLALVADDPKASDTVRKMWAKKVSDLDKLIGSLRRELDAEWEKVVKTGRVVMDDLGMAHVLAGGEHVSSDKFQVPGADGNDLKPETLDLKPEDKAKLKSLRSWLRDTRGPKEPGEKRDAYVARWMEKYREMVALGGPDTVTDAVRKAAELYGIDLTRITTN